jgi:hypothetical protein
MPNMPVLVTQFQILKTRDYVLLVFGSPSGDVADGKIASEESYRLALTHETFKELAASMAATAGEAEPQKPGALSLQATPYPKPLRAVGEKEADEDPVVPRIIQNFRH